VAVATVAAAAAAAAAGETVGACCSLQAIASLTGPAAARCSSVGSTGAGESVLSGPRASASLVQCLISNSACFPPSLFPLPLSPSRCPFSSSGAVYFVRRLPPRLFLAAEVGSPVEGSKENPADASQHLRYPTAEL
jgi:hypothetical protein